MRTHASRSLSISIATRVGIVESQRGWSVVSSISPVCTHPPSSSLTRYIQAPPYPPTYDDVLSGIYVAPLFQWNLSERPSLNRRIFNMLGPFSSRPCFHRPSFHSRWTRCAVSVANKASMSPAAESRPSSWFRLMDATPRGLLQRGPTRFPRGSWYSQVGLLRESHGTRRAV